MPVLENQAFVFTDSGRPGPRARTLKEFIGLLAALPAGRIHGHLKQHDFSRWLGDVFRDNSLAGHVHRLEGRLERRMPRTSPPTSRKRFERDTIPRRSARPAPRPASNVSRASYAVTSSIGRGAVIPLSAASISWRSASRASTAPGRHRRSRESPAGVRACRARAAARTWRFAIVPRVTFMLSSA